MRFSILGSLEVVDGERSIPLTGAKPRALLALLLLEANRVVSSDVLVDKLWGERPPATAKNTVQVYVSQLRKVLGRERLLTEQNGYRLRVDPGELDLERFERLCTEGRRALAAGRPERAALQLKEALGLWRGPALADLSYETFAAREAERLEELRLAALEERIEADLALGRQAELCSELKTLVEEHPLRERLRRFHMLALYGSGRQAEALAAYAETRDTMRDELGLEPGPELRALQRSILNQSAEVTPRAPSRARLPIARGRLVGRERELSEAAELLQRGVQLVTVTGPPGVGKTRLAIELADALSPEYADGVAFVGLASLRDASDMPATIATALELEASGHTAPLEQLASHLREQELLLVVDNLEHLPGAAALLSELLGSAPRVKLLATSRERLGLDEEHEYMLSPLSEIEAVVLFIERAQTAKPDFILTVENDDIVAAICRRLDGLPLAIELAAARARLFSPNALLARLDERLPVLSGGEEDLPARQRTLRATVDWSYDLLSGSEQRLLRAVSVFVGGFDAEAAKRVCDATVEQVDSLVSKGLLVAEAGDRFHLLETIREYAAGLLDRHGERNEFEARHARFFLALAERVTPQLVEGAEEDRTWLQRLTSEHDNFRAVLRRSLRAGQNETVARLASGLRLFWWAQNHLGEGSRWLAQALENADSLPREVRTHALSAAGVLAFHRGEFQQADELLEESLAIVQEVGNEREIADVTRHLASSAMMQGHDAQAVALYEQALATFRKLGAVADVADVVNNLGVNELSHGDYPQAKLLLEECAKAYTDLGSSIGVAVASVNLGHVALEEGDAAQAAELYRQGIQLSLELGAKTGVAECLEGFAGVAAEEGRWQQAARFGGAAEALRQETGEPMLPALVGHYERRLSRARSGLGDSAFDAAWSEGRALELGAVAAEALGAPTQKKLGSDLRVA